MAKYILFFACISPAEIHTKYTLCVPGLCEVRDACILRTKAFLKIDTLRVWPVRCAKRVYFQKYTPSSKYTRLGGYTHQIHTLRAWLVRGARRVYFTNKSFSENTHFACLACAACETRVFSKIHTFLKIHASGWLRGHVGTWRYAAGVHYSTVVL